MKRFLSSRKKKEEKEVEMKKEEEEKEKEEESLSPWQKENVKYLKKHSSTKEEEKEQSLPTTVETPEDIFPTPVKKKDGRVKRYLLPSELDEIDWTEEQKELEDKPTIAVVEKTKKKEIKKEKKVNSSSSKSENKKEGKEPTIEVVKAEPTKDKKEESNYQKELSLLDKEAEQEKKEQRLKEEKQKLKKPKLSKKVRWQTTAFIVFFTISLLVILYYASPLSNLHEVQVVGDKYMNSNKIIKTADFKPGERLWHQYFGRDEVEQRIQRAYPGIKKVDITLDRLNDFTIHVEEYPLAGYVIVDKVKYAPILENGTILKETIKNKPEGIIYADFKSGELLKSVIYAYMHLPEKIRSLVQQITLTPTKSNPELLTLYMKDGNQVKVSSSEMEEQLPYYEQVAKQMKNKGIVDMEVGIYSYPYGNNDTERKNLNASETQPTDSETSSSSTMEIVIPEN